MTNEEMIAKFPGYVEPKDFSANPADLLLWYINLRGNVELVNPEYIANLRAYLDEPVDPEEVMRLPATVWPMSQPDQHAENNPEPFPGCN